MPDENAQTWEDEVRESLSDLGASDVPSLEVLLLDALASWVLSPQNPGTGYDEQGGGLVISCLLSNLGSARRWQPSQQPVQTPELMRLRQRVADGASEIAAAQDGLTILVSRLMPAAIGELNRHAGSPGDQIFWTCYYCLLVLASGLGSGDEDTHTAIWTALEGWDQLMQQGYRLPWRQVS